MKSIAIASALALAGALSAGAAQAREPDVQWSVTIGSPGYSRPAPVYVPAPVYTPAPVIVYPRHERPVVYRAPSYWDRDGDGIPNRYDRVYNPVWDRDGDGIPNGRDRYDQRRGWDSDRDGVPNRYDRHDHNPWRR